MVDFSEEALTDLAGGSFEDYAASFDEFPDLPEGGFGWYLIRDLARDVNYEREGWCNVLTLRLEVAQEEPAAAE